jgi:hypothetical protein
MCVMRSRSPASFGVSCSRVFSCAFSAQVPPCALRPTMGFGISLVCGGAGQRGADLCPPDTSAHYGHHLLLRAGGHVRGKGARCVRVPCLLMHQHTVMCALSCSPLPAPASFWACAICVCVCVCMGAWVCVCECTRACVCVIASSLITSPHLTSPPLTSPRLAPPRPSSPPLLSPLLCRILLSSRPACFPSLSLASSVPYDPLPLPSLPIPSLHATPLPSPRFAAPCLSLSLSSSLPSPPLPVAGISAKYAPLQKSGPM